MPSLEEVKRINGNQQHLGTKEQNERVRARGFAGTPLKEVSWETGTSVPSVLCDTKYKMASVLEVF